jgi:uncharacterized membrane protein YqgA involved in biofilm formation
VRGASIHIVLGSVVVGAILGEAIRIDDGLSWLGDWVEDRVTGVGAGANRAQPEGNIGEGVSLFSKGFVTASLIFYVGPMTILGSFQDGLTGVHDTLVVKSVPCDSGWG